MTLLYRGTLRDNKVATAKMELSHLVETVLIVCSSSTVESCTTIADASLDYAVEACMENGASIVPVRN